MIIAFSGSKFAGKDTAAEALIKHFNFKRIGLADKLKDICAEVFNISREDMDNPSKKESQFAEDLTISLRHITDLIRKIQHDGFVFDMEEAYVEIRKNFYGKNLTSIRDMLQTVGTDICRTYIADDIWLQYVKQEVSSPYEKFVITDARFKNERDFFKKLGATLILIKRDSVQNNSTHISENQLGEDADYDVVMTNNETIYALQQSVQMWYQLKNKYEILYQYRR
jgi:hypothetical protein